MEDAEAVLQKCVVPGRGPVLVGRPVLQVKALASGLVGAAAPSAVAAVLLEGPVLVGPPVLQGVVWGLLAAVLESVWWGPGLVKPALAEPARHVLLGPPVLAGDSALSVLLHRRVLVGPPVLQAVEAVVGRQLLGAAALESGGQGLVLAGPAMLQRRVVLGPPALQGVEAVVLSAAVLESLQWGPGLVEAALKETLVPALLQAASLLKAAALGNPRLQCGPPVLEGLLAAVLESVGRAPALLVGLVLGQGWGSLGEPAVDPALC